jgi:ribosomal protein S18 acetylase RimI-like enzyme
VPGSNVVDTHRRLAYGSSSQGVADVQPFRITGDAGRSYEIRVEEAPHGADALVRTVIDIDLQTFSETTFSHYTAALFLKQGRVFLLYAEDEVIGTLVAMRSWERVDEVTVVSMGIRPGWRGRGLGQAFMDGVIDRLVAAGVHAVVLMVAAEARRAIRVYEDVGFREIGTTVVDQRTGETTLLMRCDLRERPGR